MTAVLIPALNAALTLPRLLASLKPLVAGGSVVVVDDGSTDETADVAKAAGVVVLRHEVNRGKGAALRTGFDYIVSSSGHDSVITMDADLQHDPDDVPKFLSAWEAGKLGSHPGVSKKDRERYAVPSCPFEQHNFCVSVCTHRD